MEIQENRKQEQDNILEALGEAAARGNLQRRFGNQVDRLTQKPWTLSAFAARLAEFQKKNSGVVDVFLFNSAGTRYSLPGIPDQLVYASQQFLKTLLIPDKPASDKLLINFAGNGGVAGLMRTSPGTMLELFNGGKNTWGGWYSVKDRQGALVGHLIIFVHRQSIEPARLLDKAVKETNRMARGKYVIGWLDPLFPTNLHPQSKSFPGGLAAQLSSLPSGESVSEWNHLSLAVFMTDEGEQLFGCSIHPLKTSDFAASCKFYFLLLLGTCFLILFKSLYGMQSLRAKLIWLFAIAGGFPLAVFLSTVAVDRKDREALLEKKICENHLEFLTKFDGGCRSEFLSTLRFYRRFYHATLINPEIKVPAYAEFLHQEVQKQHGLTSRCAIVNREGKILFFHCYDPIKPEGIRVLGTQEALPHAALNILQVVNMDTPGTSTAALSNPLMNLITTVKYASSWLDEDGLLKENQLGKEMVLTYFKLYPGSNGSYKAIFVATQDSRIGQIKYLQRVLGKTISWKRSSPRLFAVPVIPGTRWPSFPDEKMLRNPTIRKMRDLVLAGGIPQSQPLRLNGLKFLVSALRGNFLDGYILMLARPFSAIHSQTRIIATRAVLMALFMLLLAMGIAWATARGLLEPLQELGKGLSALKNRDFKQLVTPGKLTELAVVAQRFNSILEGLEDLEMARSVQETLWPAQGLSGNGWKIQGRCVTASELGGDYYDWFVLPNGHLVLAVGDVAGHGIPSALVAASAKVELAMNSEMESNPAKVLAAMNIGLLKLIGRKRPMSFWLGILDPKTLILRYSNAGQCYPVLQIPQEQLKMVEGKGYPLGSRVKAVFTDGTIDFSRGGRLFVYSDGIIEAHDPIGEPFDYTRFIALARNFNESPLDSSIKEIFREVHNWSKRPVPEDDQTLVILDIEALT
ncbi:MAG: SpoIIE family protein phosphatase [Candidatus Riflebacteria bacterium]|nr:SpoIIE family protein phosphatase [Candidatus Riflebacteria bacterium]